MTHESFRQHTIGVCLVLFGQLVVTSSGIAQESSKEETLYQAYTAVDATIPVDHLKVVLRPLIRAELEVEAQAWLFLLRAKIHEVGQTELSIKALAENESDDTLRKQLVDLRTEETALSERARIVLDALKAKGGDVLSSEQFIAAVSDISETTDATSYRAALVAEITNWASRDDGGKMWAKRAIVAAIIMLVMWTTMSMSWPIRPSICFAVHGSKPRITGVSVGI